MKTCEPHRADNLDGRLALADGSSYTWDDNGNLLARAGPRPVALSDTAFDKPAELDADGEHTYFEYDASQARVAFGNSCSPETSDLSALTVPLRKSKFPTMRVVRSNGVMHARD